MEFGPLSITKVLKAKETNIFHHSPSLRSPRQFVCAGNIDEWPRLCIFRELKDHNSTAELDQSPSVEVAGLAHYFTTAMERTIPSTPEPSESLHPNASL